MPTFSGFPADTLQFLSDLKENNTREWFQDHKQRYESSVREPALQLIEAMQAPLKKVSRSLEAIPKKTGGSLIRIYRDTRFSNDKTPYKTNLGIQFRHEAGFDVHAPGAYLHIAPEELFVCVGVWQPDKISLQAIREKIANDPGSWKRARDNKAFQAHYELTGDALKRPPAGFDKTHQQIEDIKRKDFIGLSKLTRQQFESPTLVPLLIERLKAGNPFMKFLCNCLELPY